MVDSYEEWWADEVSEKFKALMSWLQTFAVGCLVLQLGELCYRPSLVDALSQILIISSVLTFTWLGKRLEASPAWCKVGYAMVLTELTTVFNLSICQDVLHERQAGEASSRLPS